VDGLDRPRVLTAIVKAEHRCGDGALESAVIEVQLLQGGLAAVGVVVFVGCRGRLLMDALPGGDEDQLPVLSGQAYGTG